MHNDLDHIKDPLQLISVAIEDVRKFKARARRSRKLKFDVRSWHMISESGVCRACVAGAVMSGTFGVPDNMDCDPTSFHYMDSLKLRLLDAMRDGSILSLMTVKEIVRLLHWSRSWVDVYTKAYQSLTPNQGKNIQNGHLQTWGLLYRRMAQKAHEYGLRLSTGKETTKK